jgi:hypothetical protein
VCLGVVAEGLRLRPTPGPGRGRQRAESARGRALGAKHAGGRGAGLELHLQALRATASLYAPMIDSKDTPNSGSAPTYFLILIPDHYIRKS